MMNRRIAGSKQRDEQVLFPNGGHPGETDAVASHARRFRRERTKTMGSFHVVTGPFASVTASIAIHTVSMSGGVWQK